jgi:hypothetical protein
VVGETEVAACVGPITPTSSRRYWPAGMALPQRMQCFEVELI